MTWWGWTYIIGCVVGVFMLIASIGRRRNPVTAGEAILQIILQVEAGLAVAFQVQELERRTSGERPAVDADLDVPGFMAHSGYRPPSRPSVGRVSD